MEALAGERVAGQVEHRAYHALRGEVWAKALAYGRQAGEKAMARSAHREADALAAALDDPRRLGQVSRLLSIHFYARGAYSQALATAHWP
jgi:hypothetical protein